MSDYPDWFGQPRFQTPGTMKFDDDMKSCTPDEWNELFTINAKGTFNSGIISTEDPDASPSQIIKITIDGLRVFEEYIINLRERSLPGGMRQLVGLISYDTTTPRFGVVIGIDISFGKTFKVEWYPVGALASVLVGWAVRWFEIG